MGNDAKVHPHTTLKLFLRQSCSTSILEHTGPGGAYTELSACSPPSSPACAINDQRSSSSTGTSELASREPN